MLTILNLNRKENREEIFTPTSVTGEQFQEVESTSATDQVIRNAGQCVFWLFDRNAVYSKPLVDVKTHQSMTPEERAQNCTLNTTDTYLVFGEVSEETTLEALRAMMRMRVYKVNSLEFKRVGTPLVRHIRILAK